MFNLSYMKHPVVGSRRWTYSSCCVFNLSYHLVWCPKYRLPVLVDGVDVRLKELIVALAGERGWKLRSMEVMPDYVHVFISVTPSESVAQVMSVLKGLTSRPLREEFPRLRSRMPTLWSRSYYAESVGHVFSKTIERYISDQKSKPGKKRHSSHG